MVKFGRLGGGNEVSFLSQIPNLILSFTFLIILLSLHEYAHALVASWLGDRTAEYMGRKTINPGAHIDPFGTLLLPLMLFLSGSPIVFGGAKPVPVNPNALRNPKRDYALVALAGPMMNILIAFGLMIVSKAIARAHPSFGVFNFVNKVLVVPIWISLYLAAFNLMPIPPLDGFKVLLGLLPERQAYELSKLERFGMPILIGIIFIPWLLRIPVNPVFLFIRRFADGMFLLMNSILRF